MEIGNILFGNGVGGHKVLREVGYEDQLTRLFNAYASNRDTSWRDHGEERENNTFCVWPYSWCDCDCGFDGQDSEWNDTHAHAPDCYQSISRRKLAEWDTINDYEKGQRSSYEVARQLYHRRRKFENTIRRALCRDLGIPWNEGYGSAVHCTCTHDRDYQIWRESHNHHPICSASRPNFLFKPDGFWMTWYKYPLRDAYMSHNLSVAQFSEIVDRCIDSLSSDPGGDVLRLESSEGILL